MRGTIVALLIVFAAAPAAAGADVHADWLRSDEDRCDAWRYWDGNGTFESGSWSWWYFEQERSECRDTFTYAAAEAEKDGDAVASAHAGSDDASTTETTRYGSSSGSSNDSWSEWSYSEHARDAETSSWTRAATVEADDAEIVASRGCASEQEFDRTRWESGASMVRPPPPPPDDSTNTTTASHGSSGWGYSDEQARHVSSTRCADGVAASHDLASAGAARTDSCASSGSSWTRTSSWWADGNSSYSQFSESESTYACRSGVEADADGAHAGAGVVRTCDEASTSSYDTYDGTWQGRSSSSSDCREGAYVDGPDGAEAFVGLHERAWHSCHDSPEGTSCGGFGWSEALASVEWSHNPLGPSPLLVTVPLG